MKLEILTEYSEVTPAGCNTDTHYEVDVRRADTELIRTERKASGLAPGPRSVFARAAGVGIGDQQQHSNNNTAKGGIWSVEGRLAGGLGAGDLKAGWLAGWTVEE